MPDQLEALLVFGLLVLAGAGITAVGFLLAPETRATRRRNRELARVRAARRAAALRSDR